MIRKLEDMCHDINFNKADAVELMKQMDINQEFQRGDKWGVSYPTTLQAEAIDNNNVAMLSLLLENGADPNQVYDGCNSELWALQYNSCESAEIDEIRLSMAQLLLEYGANPNMNPENDPQDLFEWVWYEVCNEPYSDSWIYRGRFFILLVAYGGKSRWWTPKIVKDFDKSKMNTYRLWLLKENVDGYDAFIEDDKKEIVAYL